YRTSRVLVLGAWVTGSEGAKVHPQTRGSWEADVRSSMVTAGLGLLVAVLVAETAGSQGRKAGQAGDADWPMYRHDLAGTGHSPLTEIDAKNVARLTQVWTYRLQSDAPAPAAGRGGAGGPNSEATPIVVNGVMYLPAANRVVALEPETGKEIWRFPIAGGAPSRRGVAYWPGAGSRAPNLLLTA